MRTAGKVSTKASKLRTRVLQLPHLLDRMATTWADHYLDEVYSSDNEVVKNTDPTTARSGRTARHTDETSLPQPEPPRHERHVSRQGQQDQAYP